jgi:hypothetical protein
MNPVPGAGVADAQLPEQFGIPGAWSQGFDSLVPLFMSEPVPATK